MARRKKTSSLISTFEQSISNLLPSIDLEREIVRQALVGNIAAVSRMISPDDLWYGDTREILAAALEVFEEGGEVNPTTVCSRLYSKGVQNAATMIAGVMSNPDSPLSGASLTDKGVSYLIKCHKQSRARIKLAEVLFDNLQYLLSPNGDPFMVDAVGQSIIERVTSIIKLEPDGMMTIDAERWEDYRDMNRGRLIVECPWNKVRPFLHAIRSRQLVVVAGRPGSGKTSMLCQLAAQAALNGQRVAYFSLESSIYEISWKMLASATGIPIGVIERSSMLEEDLEKLDQVWQKFRQSKLWYGEVTYLEDILGQVKKLSIENDGIDLIVVDYLQVVGVKKYFKSNYEALCEVTKRLAKLTRNCDCAVLVGCQLSRYHMLEKRNPDMQDLRGSGSIEQDADVVLIIHPRGRDNSQIRNVIVAKNRYGRVGEAQLYFDGETSTFCDSMASSVERWHKNRKASVSSNNVVIDPTLEVSDVPF